MLRLSWLISLGISLIGFLIIGNLYSVKIEEGSGNFGFVGIIFVVPFLLLSLFTTFRYFLAVARNSVDRLMKTLSIVSGFIFIGILIYFVIDYKNAIYLTLSDSLSDLPLINEHTYTVFLNFYTFALIHAIVGLIGGIVGLTKKR
ncbi:MULTISPECIES: nucleoside-diphosphate sugar epimerase [Lysinibacillus]|uniref:Nucleoside-diphosphate sugar epimerase n=1 Tax=Lysinibacillus antri TaxID=2498145 RepID=A0A432L6T1_9BACI|nr:MULTISPECIES: nucleoside-diphosphate sugar epimerase [Lysinibacillus]RUL46481.1 nucleoside-diphosphate sugar epimerase [Lysinibacillus antri]TSI03147.1 nucleoside-diphosphate sugar epimerase [Lysinibacillus sp. BW-2-10]